MSGFTEISINGPILQSLTTHDTQIIIYCFFSVEWMWESFWTISTSRPLLSPKEPPRLPYPTSCTSCCCHCGLGSLWYLCHWLSAGCAAGAGSKAWPNNLLPVHSLSHFAISWYYYNFCKFKTRYGALVYHNYIIVLVLHSFSQPNSQTPTVKFIIIIISP